MTPTRPPLLLVGISTHTPIRAYSGRRRRLIPRALLRVLLLALPLTVLAGCTGDARAGDYNCVTPSGGCHDQLSLTAPAIDGTHVEGVSSDVQVVPLSCDSACRASSGDSAKPGDIANYIALWQGGDTSSKYYGAYIALGYRTTTLVSSDVEEYFIEYSFPGSFKSSSLGIATPTPGDFGIYPYTQFSIGHQQGIVLGPCSFGLCSVDRWGAQISPPGGAPISVTLLMDDPSSFQPTHILYAQRIYGKRGATASYALFTNNQYGDHLVDIPGTSLGIPNWHYLKNDGKLPPTGTVDHPSFSGWGLHPGSDISGGMYYLYCCKHL